MAMVFPTSPIVGQVFTSGSRSWVWNGSAWDSPSSISPTIISGLQQVLYYTSSGTFTKATYPWLRAIRVKCQAGGGAGGGATASGAGTSKGGGGGGGGYAESFITNIAALASSVTVTRGAGGTGVAGANGNAGGSSSFGSLVAANGGQFGQIPVAGFAEIALTAPPGAGGVGSSGELLLSGSPGTWAFSTSPDDFRGASGNGGASILSGGATGRNVTGNGDSAVGYGSGGAGAYNSQTQTVTRAGGNGAAGIVIVELYA
jgi:hypothetical protein